MRDRIYCRMKKGMPKDQVQKQPKIQVDCKTNLNYKKFRLVFLCNLYKMEKKERGVKG